MTSESGPQPKDVRPLGKRHEASIRPDAIVHRVDGAPRGPLGKDNQRSTYPSLVRRHRLHRRVVSVGSIDKTRM